MTQRKIVVQFSPIAGFQELNLKAWHRFSTPVQFVQSCCFPVSCNTGSMVSAIQPFALEGGRIC
jgi:hypothetical protein